jgi:hypothetical protein
MNGITRSSSSGTATPLRIFDARPTVSFPGPTPQAEDYAAFRGQDTAIVIDNGRLPTYSLHVILYVWEADCVVGSSRLRAGWASETEPRLAIENLVARYKERRAQRTYCLVGNDVLGDAAARGAAKGPFEGPVISNWDLMVRTRSWK